MRVQSLERSKYQAHLSTDQISETSLLILDEAVYRFLPEPHEAGYDAACEKMRRLVNLLMKQEKKWERAAAELAVTSCTLTTTWMKDFVWFDAPDGMDEIMLRRSQYISKFMRSNDVIFEELYGLFGDHY